MGTIVRTAVAVLLAALLATHPADVARGELVAEGMDQLGSVAALGMRAQPSSAADDVRGSLTPNQLTAGRALTREEALAACGPAAAVAFARARGREVTLDQAVALARQVGWTAERGMDGPDSQLALLARLQVPATLKAGIDRAKIIQEVQAGRPVMIRTLGGRGHYFVAERYDPTSGRFDFGQSAMVLQRSGGNRWLGLDALASLGVGTPTHTIYLQPSAPALARLWVVATGGPSARLRAEPSTAARIVGGLPNGTRVSELGPEVAAGGRTWRRVTGPGGGAAWIAADLLLAAGRW